LLPSNGENPGIRLVEPVLVVAVDSVVGVEERLSNEEPSKGRSRSAKFDEREDDFEEAPTHRDGREVSLVSESGHVGVVGSGVDHLGVHRPSGVPLRGKKSGR